MFRTLSCILGVPFTIAPTGSRGPAEIAYGNDFPDDQPVAVPIPFDEAGYEESTPFEAVVQDGRILWRRRGESDQRFDLIAGTYRLLQMLDETQVAPGARDRRGIFGNEALPAARAAVDSVPIVEHHAAALLAMLLRARSAAGIEQAPKWPGGKTWAVCLTHDTDAVRAAAPWEVAVNLAKWLLRRKRLYLDLVKAGLRARSSAEADPLFGFPHWREQESRRGLRSCFYLFVRTARTPLALSDCKSSVRRSRFPWHVLAGLQRDGWEFGLHASINAKHNLDSFLQAKHWIEDRLGAPIFGLRHHYWALDWHKPHLTFRKHVNAGFRYDTSIAWKTREGFRAATCHPYRPFDPVYDRPLDLVEMPTCLMDAYFDGARDGLERCRAVLRRVRESGGLAVLDWHTEVICNAFEFVGWYDLFEDLIGPLLDGDAWIATPWEIARHWRRREAQLLGEENGAVWAGT